MLEFRFDSQNPLPFTYLAELEGACHASKFIPQISYFMLTFLQYKNDFRDSYIEFNNFAPAARENSWYDLYVCRMALALVDNRQTDFNKCAEVKHAGMG